MLTLVQRKALQQAVDDGNELVIGGLDGRPVRRNVLGALVGKGYLMFDAGKGDLFSHVFKVTEAGKHALK